MKKPPSWLLAVLFLVALGSAISLWLSHFESESLNELESYMLSVGRPVAEFAGQGLESDKLPNLERLARATQNASGCRIRILDRERHLLIDSLSSGPQQPNVAFRVEINEALNGRYSGYTRMSDESPMSLALYAAIPITKNNRVAGVVYLSHTTDDILQRLGDLRRVLQRTVVLLALVAFVLALYYSGQWRVSLKRLRQRAGQLEGGDDVEAIGQGIDKLVASLQNQVAQLEEEKLKTRLFLEDVAHELKTPITGVSGSVESLLGEKDEERRLRLLHTLERETKRLSELVGRLVELQNLDYYELRCQPLELYSLLQTVVDTFEGEAAKKNIRLGLEGIHEDDEPRMCVWGDADKLLVVLCNLVDNALRCSPQDSKVEVTVSGGPEKVTLAVLDEGPGFQHSLIARRQRAGHSSTIGSSGLGLAIASRVVALHGAELDVRSRPEGGACVQFQLKVVESGK